MPHVLVGRSRGEPVDIYYEVHGHGPRRALWVMGLSTACQGWENQTDRFSGDAWTSVCFDNRGMGLSGSPPGYYKTSQMAQDALELLEHLGWAEQGPNGPVAVGTGVHVIGVSMGGMITMELVLLAPKVFKSVALVATTPGRTLPPLNAMYMMPRTLASRSVEERLERGLPMLYPESWLDAPWRPPAVPTARDGPADFATNRDWIVYRSTERAKRTRPQTRQGSVGQLSAVATHHVSEARLARIRDLPAAKLVLTGTVDNLVRPSNSTYLARVLDAPLVIIPGAGHAVIGERYEEVNRHLAEHFDRAELPAAEMAAALAAEKEVGDATEAFVEEGEIGARVREAGTEGDMRARRERLEDETRSQVPGLDLAVLW
ncbi:Alpha/Beta hydrolase protein [Hyaloraphidium curvatum]|nr:Alpha/Beta hydrolase protein [Hyaloraphidium curvatum]